MPLTHYYYTMAQGRDSTVRAFMNDIPFYKRTVKEQVGATSPAIHLLEEGENVLTLEVDEAPTEGYFELTDDFDHQNPVVYVGWPAVMEKLPEEERKYPLRYSTVFVPQGEVFRPAYVNVPKVAPSKADMEQIADAIRKIHAAAEKGDVAAYLEAMSLKIDEYQRAYQGFAGMSPTEIRDDMEGLFSHQTVCRPLEIEKLQFEPRAEGRVVHVTHLEGGHVIEVVSQQRPSRRLRTDLTFTKANDEWRVFR